MNNLIEFLRMVFSYLFVSIVICAVSTVGAIVGVKCWKPKQKETVKSE